IAIMDCIREERLLGRIIEERHALGKTVERTLVLRAHQATRARFLDHLVNTLEERLSKLFLVSILHAHIERIAPLLAQLPCTFVAIAWGRASAVEPYAVKLILGDKLLDEVKFSLHKRFPANAELPHVRPISLVFGGRLGSLGVGARLGAPRC